MTAEECIDRIVDVMSRDITISQGPYFQIGEHSTNIIYPSGKDTLERLLQISSIIREYKKGGAK